jgi:hypothetical protein
MYRQLDNTSAKPIPKPKNINAIVLGASDNHENAKTSGIVPTQSQTRPARSNRTLLVTAGLNRSLFLIFYSQFKT